MLKKLLIITLLLTTSCSMLPKGWKWGLKPRPIFGVKNFPDTNSYYGKGFKDGCGSAWSAVAKGILSDVNGRKYNFKALKESSDYNTGWWEGFEQCTYMLDWDVT